MQNTTLLTLKELHFGSSLISTKKHFNQRFNSLQDVLTFYPDRRGFLTGSTQEILRILKILQSIDVEWVGTT